MITLEIDNSYSRILGLTSSQVAELKALLSYEVDSHPNTFRPAYRKSLLSAKWEFPTGLLTRVAEWIIVKSRLDLDITDLRKRPTTLMQDATPFDDIAYPDQKRAAEEAILCGRGTISMPTGTGKSIVIGMIAAKLGVKTLIIVPNLGIKKQLRESLKMLKNVTVENIDSKALQTPKDYGCLIIDEAHHVAAKTYQKLNRTAWKGIYYRFFFTATPFRNNPDESLLFEAIAGYPIYQLTYKDAVERKYIVPVEAYYYDVPKSIVEGYTWHQVYDELIVGGQENNVVVSRTLLDLAVSNASFLCLVKEVRHGKILSYITGIPFISGADENRDILEEFSSGIVKGLIATEGILGEGIDTKACEFVVVAGLGKAKSAFMQKIGRAVRKFAGKTSAKVILFRNPSHKWTLKHFNAQKKILKDEYGVTVQRLK